MTVVGKLLLILAFICDLCNTSPFTTAHVCSDLILYIAAANIHVYVYLAACFLSVL